MKVRNIGQEIAFDIEVHITDVEIKQLGWFLAALQPPRPDRHPVDASDVEGLDHPSDFVVTQEIPDHWLEFRQKVNMERITWETTRDLLASIIEVRNDFMSDMGRFD